MIELPEGLYRKPDSPFLWIGVRVDGLRIRRSTKTADVAKAKEILARVQAESGESRRVRKIVNHAAQLKHDIPKAELLRIYKRAKSGAAQRGLPFELIPADIDALAAASLGRCAVTGIVFEAGTRGPFAISVDRIDCAKHYTIANCRLVCTIVNFALNTFGDDAFDRMATMYVANKLVRAAKS